jgi:tetratricopeptide (TPR) repeat protein
MMPTVRDPAHVDGDGRGKDLSVTARRAAQAGNWPVVQACARELLTLDRKNPEGWFLSGLAEKAAGRSRQAVDALRRVIRLDSTRYDAAIELAWLHWSAMRHREARDLLERYENQLGNSPLYLDLAADTWTRLGLHARAWPLYLKASELQPGIEKFQASLAACAVLLGKIREAKSLYLQLLDKHPHHQRNHYELSRLERARDTQHIEQMKQVLDSTRLPAEKNIFLYYAIAKELEDLGRWEESFDYYRRGGDAAAQGARAAGYDVSSDIALMDRIIEVCSPEWLARDSAADSGVSAKRTPLFVVGLPRTGTTLTERILSSHSLVESADETFFLQIAIRRASGVQSRADMNPRMIAAAARQDIGTIARDYLDAVSYRLGDKPLFIDKYPFNFLYLGFIVRAFPGARVVHLRRHPMDACFAMYKQSFFRFAYTLDDLARYYAGYDRLSRYWREHLGERLIELEYESLVADPDRQIRGLLERLGLGFEQACLDFHLNQAPSATASAVQVREQAHTRSVGRWRKFERQLQPLRDRLEAAGIDTG